MTKTRTLLLTLWALVLTVLSASGRGVEPDSLLVFRHGGMERSYRLYVPDSLAAGRPLVIMLHGYGGTASPEAFGILAAARRYGFAACFPQGAADARGKSCWNVGYPFQEGLQTDDVDFICSLAGYLVGEYGLDARNVFCTGHSNGGEMCYLMAYRRPDVFAAVAPIAGLTLEWMYHDLEASKPIPLMELHGTEDKTSLWCGDPRNEGGWAHISPYRLRWAIGLPPTDVRMWRQRSSRRAKAACASRPTDTGAARQGVRCGSTRSMAEATHGLRM